MDLQKEMLKVIKEIDQVQGSHYEEQSKECTKIALQFAIGEIIKISDYPKFITQKATAMVMKLEELQTQLNNLDK